MYLFLVAILLLLLPNNCPTGWGSRTVPAKPCHCLVLNQIVTVPSGDPLCFPVHIAQVLAHIHFPLERLFYVPWSSCSHLLHLPLPANCCWQHDLFSCHRWRSCLTPMSNGFPYRIPPPVSCFVSLVQVPFSQVINCSCWVQCVLLYLQGLL